MSTYKTFLSPGGQQTHGVIYLNDPNLLVTNTNDGSLLATGGFRPLQTTDFQVTVDSVSISGINVNTDQLETINTSGVQYLAALSGHNDVNYSTVSNSTISGSMTAFTTGIALPSTSTRKEGYIQVVGSGGPLFLAFNGNAASMTNFNVILKNGSADPAQDGGIWTSDQYTGPVSVSGGQAVRWISWQG